MTIVHAPKCTGCGSPLNAPLQGGKIKCDYCGTLNIISSQNLRADEKICPECGAVNPIDANHCTHCRAKLIFPCPACKATNFIGAVYCVRCGTDMKAEAVRQADESKQQQEEAKQRIETDAKRNKVKNRTLVALVLIPSVVFLLIFAISPMATSLWINNLASKIIGMHLTSYFSIPMKIEYPTDNSCSNAYGGRLKIGDTAQVIVFQITIRDKPGGSGYGSIVGYLNRGREMVVLEGPLCMNKMYFVRIRSEINTEGWVVEGDEENYYLQPIIINFVTAQPGAATKSGK
jgi:ribosomal protein L40E